MILETAEEGEVSGHPKTKVFRLTEKQKEAFSCPAFLHSPHEIWLLKCKELVYCPWTVSVIQEKTS